MYQGLLMPSCEADPALSRSVVLAEEAKAVAALEARLRATALGYQLKVAREDIEQGGTHCWADDDPRFAQKHVKMARDQVTTGLQELKRLSFPTPQESTDVADAQLPNAVAYRTLVRTAVTNLLPLCTGTTAAPDGEVLAPARAALARYRARVKATHYARQFALAEADAIYVREGMVVECSEPGNDAPSRVAAAALEQTEADIAKMEEITQPPRQR
jgi:hypothetical protein